jgi:ribosome-binding factor A
MARPNFRLERVNAIIKEILSEIVLKDIKDPRLGLVTIVSVSVAADLGAAKVHFSVLGDEGQRAESLRILRGAGGFMRHAIARELEIKVAPELRWVYDDSLDRAFRIAEVLREDASHPAAEESAGPEDAPDTTDVPGDTSEDDDL